MQQKKKEHPKEKAELHPRNKHRERYDFEKLIQSCPDLAQFVFVNKYEDQSIDFSNSQAVKTLNKALLIQFYGLQFWDIPANYLCPPIPGRADYIHYLADLLTESLTHGATKHIKCLDVGVGANCIYPIIGSTEYGWHFVGSDIDKVSIASAQKIVDSNPQLNGKIELRLQTNQKHLLKDIIQANERFEITMCNPPFHASAAEAQAGSLRKLRNLKGKKVNKVNLNFGGQNNELWCEGGEPAFLKNMILESQHFAKSCIWFTSLVSKESNLKAAYRTLEKVKALEIKTVSMGQGNKISRMLAWTFLNKTEQQNWEKTE